MKETGGNDSPWGATRIRQRYRYRWSTVILKLGYGVYLERRKVFNALTKPWFLQSIKPKIKWKFHQWKPEGICFFKKH